MEHIGEPIHLVHTHVYKAPLKKVVQENSTSRGIQGSNAKQTWCNNARGARNKNANATCAKNQNANQCVGISCFIQVTGRGEQGNKVMEVVPITL